VGRRIDSGDEAIMSLTPRWRNPILDIWFHTNPQTARDTEVNAAYVLARPARVRMLALRHSDREVDGHGAETTRRTDGKKTGLHQIATRIDQQLRIGARSSSWVSFWRRWSLGGSTDSFKTTRSSPSATPGT